ncbi:hypothetical protein ACMA1I_08825 [Pontibacter sp. 13R65]|uniref:hypothetical protein n=1 Tax=Pontibacter sp. 13R65 TaxID=3127458 RepID=UPI00301E5E82
MKKFLTLSLSYSWFICRFTPKKKPLTGLWGSRRTSTFLKEIQLLQEMALWTLVLDRAILKLWLPPSLMQ